MLLHSSPITLHGVRSKSLKQDRQVTPKKQANNQAEMAESEGIQAIVAKVPIQAATVVMMVLRDTDP